VASHYCGGALAQVKWSLNHDLAGCGMDDHGKTHPKRTEWKETCCQDVIGVLGTDGQYDVSTNIPLNYIGQLITIIVSVLTPLEMEQTETSTAVFPPGNLQPSRVSRNSICVYRI
jgi:hypothetical protein